MKVGEKAILTAVGLAYVDGGLPPTIPCGATLIFDVECWRSCPSRARPPGISGAGADPTDGGEAALSRPIP